MKTYSNVDQLDLSNDKMMIPEDLNNEQIIILYKNFLKSNIDNLNLNDNELKIIQILNNITKEYSPNINNSDKIHRFSAEVRYLNHGDISQSFVASDVISCLPNVMLSDLPNVVESCERLYKNYENFITFIIPTIGRQSLLNTIKSLQNLLNPNWKAVIIFDGIKNNFKIDDIRITILEHEKKGKMSEISGNAGLVRNIGLNYINNSEYIAFLHDDDYIHPNYINYLKEEISMNEDIDICIFRMIDKNNLVLPRKNDNKIIKTKVGISFAININIAKKFQFTNSNFEDYLFLKKVELYGGKIVISKYISYYVRIEPFTIYEEFPRIIIENNS
jgi:hypothetical protein